MSDTDEPLHATPPHLGAGFVFAGRFRIERLLGEGERKSTYLAYDSALNNRRVALAVTRPDAAHADPGGTRREVAALADVGSHDNIVSLYDSGVACGCEYVVLEYMSGGTLSDDIRRHASSGEPLAVEEILRIGRQLARALCHLHGRGMIHRDVAPANIWLDERRVAHLGDLDSAVPISGVREEARLPSTSGAYEPPELLVGKAADERSDLYALGAVLFEMATGCRPSRKKPSLVAERLATREPGLPGGLQLMICRLLSPSPDDRPQGAEEVVQALVAPRGPGTIDTGVLPWVDTLPFPLASILWHYAGEPEPAAKVDYLLKYFEALAQFGAVVQLSAVVSDPEFLAAHKTEWFYGRLDLRQATFGTWGELCRRLSGTGRTQLASGDECANRYLRLYSSPDLTLVEALTDPSLTAILDAARQARNTWSGHGGVAGREIHRSRLSELERLLTDARAHLGWSFAPWTLFRPEWMTLARGVYEVTASILTGPNPAFSRRALTLTHPVDASRLYLVRDGSTEALELAPLIRVTAALRTGQDACYLYRQLSGHEAHWVSYHFHAEPELTTSDGDVAELLASLASDP